MFAVLQVSDEDLKQYAVAKKQPLGKTSHSIQVKKQVSTASVAISAPIPGQHSTFNNVMFDVQT